MRFAEYPLERAYLLHELAQAHLDYNSFDGACSLARKALDGEYGVGKVKLKSKSIPQRLLSARVLCGAS